MVEGVFLQTGFIKQTEIIVSAIIRHKQIKEKII
jgi:hypothetical protein